MSKDTEKVGATSAAMLFLRKARSRAHDLSSEIPSKDFITMQINLYSGGRYNITAIMQTIGNETVVVECRSDDYEDIKKELREELKG